MKTSQQNITGSNTIHGVVLAGNEVQRILNALADMRGDYPKVADEIRHVLNGADLSCAKCPDDCMDVRVCETCGTEGHEDDGTKHPESGDWHCDACNEKERAYWERECRTYVPTPTDAEAAEIRRLKGMER